MKVKYKKSEAILYGFKKLEKMAKQELKKNYKGDWNKAIIKCDVVDGEIVYEVIK